LRRLGMTRISVAHRPEAAAGADHIFYIARRCASLEPKPPREEIAPTRDPVPSAAIAAEPAFAV
jgi:hypothetical protein